MKYSWNLHKMYTHLAHCSLCVNKTQIKVNILKHKCSLYSNKRSSLYLKENTVSSIQMNWLTLFRKMITVNTNMRYLSTLCGKK